MKVLVRGITYESVKDASIALGVTTDGIYSALCRGNVDALGLGRTKPKSVTINNMTFKSVNAASVALGFSRARFREMLLSGKHIHRERIDQAFARYVDSFKGDPECAQKL